jgi:hypothetical protein
MTITVPSFQKIKWIEILQHVCRDNDGMCDVYSKRKPKWDHIILWNYLLLSTYVEIGLFFCFSTDLHPTAYIFHRPTSNGLYSGLFCFLEWNDLMIRICN